MTQRLHYYSYSCMTENHKRRGCREKVYSENYSSMMKIAVEQVTGGIRGFVLYLVPTEQTTPTSVCMHIEDISMAESMELLQKFCRDSTVVVANPKSYGKLISVKKEWIKSFIGINMGLSTTAIFQRS